MHLTKQNPSNDSVAINCIALVVGLAPVFLSWGYKEFVNPRPFWGYFDHFETLYYYTGVNLVETFSSLHSDNPAGPLQLLSALLVSLTGTDPVNYPQFLFLAHLLVVVSVIIAAWLLVRYLFVDLSVFAKVTAVAIFFVSAESIQYTHYWGPEALYFLFGVLFFVLFIKLVDSHNFESKALYFWTAFSLGLCVAEKFVFLVWLPAYLLALLIIVLPKNPITSVLNKYSLSLLGITLGFIVPTIFLIKQYPYMFDWVLGLMTRDGPYGKGEVAAIDFSIAIQSWLNYVNSAKSWFLLMLILLFAVIIDCLKNKNKVVLTYSLLIFFIFVLLFSMLAIMRGMNLRYLLPLGLCGILIFYLASKTEIYKNKLVQAGFCALVMCLVVKHMLFDISIHNLRISNVEKLRHQTQSALQQLPDSQNLVFIYSFRYPTASFALRQHQYKEHHQRVIDNYYPKEGHFIPFVEKPYFRLPNNEKDWDVLVIRHSDLEKFPASYGQTYKKIGNYSIVLSPDFKMEES